RKRLARRPGASPQLLEQLIREYAVMERGIFDRLLTLAARSDHLAHRAARRFIYRASRRLIVRLQLPREKAAVTGISDQEDVLRAALPRLQRGPNIVHLDGRSPRFLGIGAADGIERNEAPGFCRSIVEREPMPRKVDEDAVVRLDQAGV